MITVWIIDDDSWVYQVTVQFFLIKNKSSEIWYRVGKRKYFKKEKNMKIFKNEKKGIKKIKMMLTQLFCYFKSDFLLKFIFF